MDKLLREKAIELSKMGYATDLLRDKTTDGEYIFLAVNPELEGCMAQGETPEDAVANLEDVRIDYMEHLLEFNLPIPCPGLTETKDTAAVSITTDTIQNITFPGFEKYLTQAVRPNAPVKLFSVTPSS
ncbi:MAG: type II toxin-antitoxin system HicB family antitoxin [Anaerolineales bacterium]|jgi:predicted RNase H-like HicB family nuclease